MINTLRPVLLIGASALAASTALAQSVTPEPEEVVVTARKRSESVQTVPLSITVVDAEAIERNSITTLDQAGTQAPNVKLQPVSNEPIYLAPYIRGIGTRSGEPSQEAPIAISIDGVYLSQVAGSLVDVFDVDRIEILRGPQGTLQGRNASGGAINVTTRRPGEIFGARAEAAYESYDSHNVKAGIEGPIVSGVLAAKLAGFEAGGGGYMHDVTTGSDLDGVSRWGGRFGLLFTPVPNFTSYLTADYINDTSPQRALRVENHAGPSGPREPQPTACTLYGACDFAPRYDSEQDYVNRNHSNNGGLALNNDWVVGPSTLTAVTGYRHVDDHVTSDVDATRFTILNALMRHMRIDAISQELRIASSSPGAVDYAGGLYYIHYYYNLNAENQLGGKIFQSTADRFTYANRKQSAESYAAFGQATYHLTEKWSLSGGGRETLDHKDGHSTPAIPGPTGELEARFSNFSGEAGSEYRLAAQALAYLRFSQGYRAGGINAAASSLAGINTYRPEKVNSYEIGLKSQWLERRVTANLSAFHYDYKDMQITAVDQTSVGTVSRIVNAAGARIDGLELESSISGPSHDWRLGASLGYLNDRYRPEILNLGFGPQDISELRHEFAPHWSGYLSGDYVLPLPAQVGQITLSTDLDFTSAFTMNPVDNAVGQNGGYTLVNASLSYTSADGRYRTTVFCKNCADRYYTDAGEANGGFSSWVHVGPPRFVGVRIAAKL